jgi:magnesium-transporting ATPase (P-type)
VLAIDLGTDLLPAIALGTEKPEPRVMDRPPRRRSERLLNRRVLARVYGFVGLIVGISGLVSFFAGYWLAGWRPGDALADEGALYLQATAMTYAGIVMGQVGAAAWPFIVLAAEEARKAAMARRERRAESPQGM